MKDEGRGAAEESGPTSPSASVFPPSSFILHPSSFPPWLAALLQTTDSLFPTGAYAHSGGLETLAALGVVSDARSLSAFLRGRIVPMLGGYELPYLGFAMAAARAGDPAALAELDREFGAGKLPREAREASVQVGGQRLRMLARAPSAADADGVSAEAFGAAISRGEADGHAAIVCGLQAHRQGAPVEAAMTAYFYGCLAGYCSAALKLIRIGQEGCQGVLSEGLALAGQTVAHALTVPREEAGWCDPGLEIAAARHERAFARLFIS